MELRIPDSDLDTYLGFLDESREHLDCIEEKVLGLRACADPEVVNVLFRALHTVKGIAGFLGLADIQRLGHRLESVFDAIRQGRLALGEEPAIAHLAGLDRLQDLIGALSRGLERRARGTDGDWAVVCEDPGYAAAYDHLGALLEPAPQAVPAPSEEELITPEMRAAFLKEAEELLDATEQIFLALEAGPGDRDALARAFRNIHSFKGNCGFFGYARLEQASHRLESVLDRWRAGEGPVPKAVLAAALGCLDVFAAALPGGPDGALPDREGALAALDALAGDDAAPGDGAARGKDAAPAASLPVAERDPPGKAAAEAPRAPQREAKRDLRVDLAKLDHLMDLVGELVISTGMMFNHPVLRGCADPDLERVSHQLKGVVSELQAVALGVRMIPVEGAFRKMTRLVHDLSSKVGKQARL
jgi:two-component system chemotaxis sensor kinase CheA